MKKLLKQANKGVIGLRHGNGGIVAEYIRDEARRKYLKKQK